MGGAPGGSIDRDQHEVEDWERLADAINGELGAKGFQSTDELRRAIESLEEYRDLSYYERWVAATEKLLLEKGILSSEEIDERSASIRRRWDGPLSSSPATTSDSCPQRSPATYVPQDTSRGRPGGSKR